MPHLKELKGSKHFISQYLYKIRGFVLLTSSLYHWVSVEQTSFLSALHVAGVPHVSQETASFFGAGLTWQGFGLIVSSTCCLLAREARLRPCQGAAGPLLPSDG